MKRIQATHWRDRVALSASAAIGQSSDEEVIHRARTLVDQSWFTVVTGFVLLAVLLGALIGWTTTAVILRPAEGPVNPVVALLLIAGVPWLLLALRSLVLLALRWRVSSGHLVPSVGGIVIQGLLRSVCHSRLPRSVRRDSADSPFSLASSVVQSITDMLADRSGRPLAAAGSGAFWTTYAVIAIATIWISTAHVALGFGWESSWVSSDSYRAVVDSAPLIGSDELTPVAIDAPAHDPAAMATRRAWLRFISDGVTIYLLLPMLALTLIHAVNWRRQSDVWRPLLWRPLSSVGPCTHIVRLARAKCADHLPAPLDGLVDLGSPTRPPTCRTYSASFAATRTASPSSVGCQPNRITPSRYCVPSPKPLESRGRYSCSTAALRCDSTRPTARWRPWMPGTCSRGRRTSLSSNANSRS